MKKILLIFAFIFSVSSIFSKGSTSFGEDYDNDYVLVKGAVFDGEDENLPRILMLLNYLIRFGIVYP